MRNNQIPDMAVDAAARALWMPSEVNGTWEAEREPSLLEDARAALEAAAPHMLNWAKAEGWDYGYEAGWDEQTIGKNPYL